MSEIVIRIRFPDLGGRWFRAGRWLMAGAMLFSAVPELASESVTLTTYYPAPSGVYTQMITTGNTYLSRDAATTPAQVLIGGGAATGTGHMLDIYSYMGSANNSAIRATYPGGGGLLGTEFAALAHRFGFWSGMYANQGSASYAAYINGNGTASNTAVLINGGGINGNYGLTPGYQNWAAWGTGAGGAAIYNDAGGYRTLMLVGNNSAGGVRQVSVWDQLNVNGDTYHNGKSFTSGTTYMAGGSYSPASNVAYAGGACFFTTYAAGANIPVCPGSWYVTLTGGYMSKYTVISNSLEPQGDALCCPCPGGLNVGYASGCPAL